MVPQLRAATGMRYLLALLLCWGYAAASASAQTGPRIEHGGLKCVLSGEYLQLQARVLPVDGLTTVKAYFRANLYTQFYYVEMQLNGDHYEGLLPKPSPEIDGLHYYLEAMDTSFIATRTAEYTPQVVGDESKCEEDNPVPPVYANPAANIAVGSTSGAPLPPGFFSEALVAIPRLTGSGGSGLLIGSAVGAGAAAAAVGILVVGGEDEGLPPTTTSVPVGVTSAPTTTSVGGATTTSSSAQLMACFSTTPDPPRINVGSAMRFDGSCSEPRASIASYSWDLSDGRNDRVGRVVNRVYNQAGTFPAELTITGLDGATNSFSMNVIVEESAGGVTPPPGGGGPTTTVPGNADLTLTLAGPGSVPPGNTASYTINYSNGGPDFDPSVTVNVGFGPAGAGTVSFESAAGCSPSGNLNVSCFVGGVASGGGGSITVNVHYSADTYFVNASIFGGTTDPGPNPNNRNLMTTSPQLAPPGAPGRLTTRLTSHLDLPPGDGTTQARLTFNESRNAVTDNSGPSTHDVPGRNGENIIDGALTRQPPSEGVWRFDFTGAPGFAAGSFVVEVGDIVSRSSHHIAFRVAPSARRVRFRFRLSRQ